MHFHIIKNIDPFSESLENKSLENSICFFAHIKTFNHTYYSPISLKYVHKGNLIYNLDNKAWATEGKKLFYLTSPNIISASIPGNFPTKGFSIFYNKDWIKSRLERKLSSRNLFLLDSLFSGSLMGFTDPFDDKIKSSLCELLYRKLECGVNSKEVQLTLSSISELFLESLSEITIKAEKLGLQKENSTIEVVKKLVESKNFIRNNYSRRMNLKIIAENACLSKYCFQRYFKTFFNISPTEYLMRIRLEKAKGMLLEMDRGVGEIASECGFNSNQYFTYVFKNNYGASPNAYKQSILN